MSDSAPKGLRKRGRVWWIDVTLNGSRIQRSTGTSNIEIAHEILSAERLRIERSLVPGTNGWTTRSGWESEVERERNKGGWLYQMHSNLRRRCRDRNKSVRLSLDELHRIALRSAGRCELTHLPFQTRPGETSHKRPFFPSIDRIDSSRDYDPGNVRLVCVAVNYALNDWGEDVFATIAEAYVASKLANRNDML